MKFSLVALLGAAALVAATPVDSASDTLDIRQCECPPHFGGCGCGQKRGEVTVVSSLAARLDADKRDCVCIVEGKHGSVTPCRCDLDVAQKRAADQCLCIIDDPDGGPHPCGCGEPGAVPMSAARSIIEERKIRCDCIIDEPDGGIRPCDCATRGAIPRAVPATSPNVARAPLRCLCIIHEPDGSIKPCPCGEPGAFISDE